MNYSCGQDVRRIRNKCFVKFRTPYTKNIALAFDRSSIPYFARISGDNVSLVYDADFVVFVSEIIAKSQSEDYEKIMQKNYDLLTEIAKILNVEVGYLKNIPDEIQSALCRFYVIFWFCDTLTLKSELTKILMTD